MTRQSPRQHGRPYPLSPSLEFYEQVSDGAFVEEFEARLREELLLRARLHRATSKVREVDAIATRAARVAVETLEEMLRDSPTVQRRLDREAELLRAANEREGG